MVFTSSMAFPDSELLIKPIILQSASGAEATSRIALHGQRTPFIEGNTVISLDDFNYWRWRWLFLPPGPGTGLFGCRRVACDCRQILRDCDVILGLRHRAGATITIVVDRTWDNRRDPLVLAARILCVAFPSVTGGCRSTCRNCLKLLCDRDRRRLFARRAFWTRCQGRQRSRGCWRPVFPVCRNRTNKEPGQRNLGTDIFEETHPIRS